MREADKKSPAFPGDRLQPMSIPGTCTTGHRAPVRRRAHEASGDRARGRLPAGESLALGPFSSCIVLAYDWPFSVAICLPALPSRPRQDGEVREMTLPVAERGRPATDERDPGLQGGSGMFLVATTISSSDSTTFQGRWIVRLRPVDQRPFFHGPPQLRLNVVRREPGTGAPGPGAFSESLVVAAHSNRGRWLRAKGRKCPDLLGGG